VNKSGTILHVEDDENDAFFFRRALSKAGVTNALTQVIDGQAAVDYLNGIGLYCDREKYPFPCLLITDLKMPVLSGLTCS
jgi:CheY-like chemotaxis protein